MDIQKLLDDWLESHPNPYIKKLVYIAPGETMPGTVTHVLRLSSAQSPERHLTVGLVLVPQYAALLELLLSVIGTVPRES